MDEPEALAVIGRFFQAINAGDIDTAAAATASDYVHHSGAGDLDLDGFREGFPYYKAAFPDLTYDVEEMLAVDGGTAVVARWTMRGTHRGPFFSVPGSDRSIESDGLSLHRIVDGRIGEDWEFSDDVGLLRSLGFRLEPPDPTRAT